MGTGISPLPLLPGNKNKLIKRLRKGVWQYGQASRSISTGRVNALPHLRLLPINPLVSRGPSVGSETHGMTYLGAGFPLRCLQRLSLPDSATQRLPLARQLVHRRSVHLGPLVLKVDPLNHPSITADRDRTVSRRSEPSSRTALIGEQPNPWDLLQPQDAMSRHRGAKPPRRCGRLGEISLLSPG